MSRHGWRLWGAVASAVLVGPMAVSEAPAMTLAEAAESAFRSNPNLQASRYAYQAALAGRREASAAYLPQVELNAALARTSARDEFKGPDGLTDVTANSEPLNVDVEISQSLYTGGGRRAATEFARAQAEAARYGVRAAEQQILLDVVFAYADTVEAQELFDIGQGDVATLRELVSATEKRLAAGIVSRTDLHQAQGRLAVAQANLLSAELDLDAARAAFAEVIGVAPGDLIWPELTAAQPPSLADAIDRARTANPEVLRAMQAEQRFRAQERSARAGLRPTLTLRGGVQRAWPEYDEVEGVQTATAQLRLRIPLYEGGIARARIRQTRANQQRAQAETEALRRELISAATSAWSEVNLSRGIIEAGEAQLASTRQALDGVSREQALGLRTTLDVLLANDDVRRAEASLAASRRDALVADYRLLFITGGLQPEAFGITRLE
jgi:outer membrane protein